MNKRKTRLGWWWAVGFVISVGLVGCGANSAPAPTSVPLDGPTATPATNSDSAYPGNAYPTPHTPQAYPNAVIGSSEEVLPAPPNPARDLPKASADSGVIGGALIRELSAEGFMPLDPHELILASIVTNDAGTPMFLRHDEDALRAETFPTGVFVFRDVPPGRYGLIIGIGLTQFPVRTPDGAELLVDVTPGAVIDLGQVIVQFP